MAGFLLSLGILGLLIQSFMGLAGNTPENRWIVGIVGIVSLINCVFGGLGLAKAKFSVICYKILGFYLFVFYAVGIFFGLKKLISIIP